MAKQKKQPQATTPYTFPGATADAQKKWQQGAMALGALLVLGVVAAHFFVPPQPRPIVWLLGLACAGLGSAVHALATHQPEHDEMLMRLQRGQHFDFGRALRATRKERKKVKLPLVGETTMRRVIGIGIFVVIFVWWLTPLAPVAVAERKIEDLTAPLAGEILAPVLVMPEPQLATLQPPMVSPQARELAREIPDEADALKRGQRALALGQYAEAREILAGASAEPDVPPLEVDTALAQVELYAWNFEKALTAYRKAIESHGQHPTLLCQAAVAAMLTGRYSDARAYAAAAVEILDHPEGEGEHQDQAVLAAALHLQAVLLTVLGKTPEEYDEAERLYARAKEIQGEEGVLGPQHPCLGATVNNQAVLNQLRARFPGVLALHTQAHDLWRGARGERDVQVAASLGNLAMYHLALGHYAEARKWNAEAAAIRREFFTAEDEEPVGPVMGVSLAATSVIERTFARYDEAEKPAQKALAIFEESYGPDHPTVAASVNALASLYADLARYLAIAKPYYLRAEGIATRTLGPEHPYVAVTLNHRAELALAQGQYASARDTATKALEIATRSLGGEHPVVASILNTLGRVELEQGNPSEARPLLTRARRALEKTMGKASPGLARTLGNLAALDNGPLTYTKGVRQYEDAVEMTEGFYDEDSQDHPVVARLLLRAAQLLIQRDRLEEAEPYLKRAMEIQEKVLVPSQPFHPELADTLEAYAGLLRKLRPSEAARADKMAGRAAEIRAKHQEQDRPRATEG